MCQARDESWWKTERRFNFCGYTGKNIGSNDPRSAFRVPVWGFGSNRKEMGKGHNQAAIDRASHTECCFRSFCRVCKEGPYCYPLRLQAGLIVGDDHFCSGAIALNWKIAYPSKFCSFWDPEWLQDDTDLSLYLQSWRFRLRVIILFYFFNKNHLFPSVCHNCLLQKTLAAETIHRKEFWVVWVLFF